MWQFDLARGLFCMPNTTLFSVLSFWLTLQCFNVKASANMGSYCRDVCSTYFKKKKKKKRERGICILQCSEKLTCSLSLLKVSEPSYCYNFITYTNDDLQ